MRINYLAVVGCFVGMSLMYSACQDDDAYERDFDCGESFVLEIPDTTSYAPVLSKPAIPRKYDSIYCMNQEFSFATATKYTTMKIRNLSGTIVQEWLFEDLRSDLFQYVVQPNDPDGAIHGYYYSWESNLSDVSMEDWEYMLCDGRGEPVIGFHIPDRADISRLATILGGSNKIPQYLNLVYDGSYSPSSSSAANFKSNNAAFWTDPLDDKNRMAGCGVVADWFYPGSGRSDNWITSYTNIKTLCVNVRLVRNLSVSQW